MNRRQAVWRVDGWVDGWTDGGGWVEDALTLAQILAQGESERQSWRRLLPRNWAGVRDGIKKPPLHLVAATGHARDVINPFLLGEEREGEGEGRMPLRRARNFLISLPCNYLLLNLASSAAANAADENICCWRPGL